MEQQAVWMVSQHQLELHQLDICCIRWVCICTVSDSAQKAQEKHDWAEGFTELMCIGAVQCSKVTVHSQEVA